MKPPEPRAAVREVVRHHRRLPELATLVVNRCGFADSDGGFGVTYPEDLDEYDLAMGAFIPPGFVELYGYWGPPDGYEMLVAESLYLDELSAILAEAGHADEAATVRALLDWRMVDEDESGPS